MFGNFAALAAKRDEGIRPRTPPPPATPLDFPSCEPKFQSDGLSKSREEILSLFSNILRKGPSIAYLDALNIDLQNNLDLEVLLPSYVLPPKRWAFVSPDNDGHIPQPQKLGNGVPSPDRRDFYIRAQELQYANEDVYNALSLLARQGKKSRARLVYFRKFWEEMDQMADYWDSSQDKYFKTAENNQPGASPMQSTMSKGVDESDPMEYESHSDDSPATRDHGVDAKNLTERYTGRRKHTGREMPPGIREYALFALFEAIAPVFRCRVEHAKIPPRLLLCGTYFPLPHLGFVHRVPADIREARRGVMEGPVLGLGTCGCGDTVSFRKEDEAVGEGKIEILHLLKEVGSVLLVGQRRAREGTEEVLPGLGQWWVENRRWGGGSGEAIGTPLSMEQEVEEDEALTRMGHGKEKAKQQAKAMARSQRPPASTWEKNVRYHRVGKSKEADFDDIYFVSSVNTHISIIHARISTRFIESLEGIVSKQKQAAPTAVTTSAVEGQIDRSEKIAAAAAAALPTGVEAAAKEGRQSKSTVPPATASMSMSASTPSALLPQHQARTPTRTPTLKQDPQQEQGQGQQTRHKIELRRSKWFDLLNPSDRVDALRGIWAVMAWQMRDIKEGAAAGGGGGGGGEEGGSGAGVGVGGREIDKGRNAAAAEP